MDSITVTATYSGNDDNDGSALLYYKQHSSSSWLATDGAMAKGYLTKQYRKTISGLSENTEYDVKVLYSDPDGVIPPNPIYKYRIKNAQSGGTPPSAPTLDDPGATDGDGTYVVRWSYRVDATHYELEEAGANSQTYNNIMYVSQSFSGKENGVYNYRVRACNEYGCSGWSNVESITVSLEPVSDNSYAGALYSGRVQNANDAKSYLHGVYKVKIIERLYTEPSFDQIEATAIIYKNSVSLGLYTLKYHEMVYADDGNVQVLLKEAGVYKPSYEYGEDVAICTKTSSSDVNANPMVMCLAPGENQKISLTLPPGAYDEFYFTGSARDWANRQTSTEAEVTVPSSTPDGTYTLSIMVMSGGVGLPVYSIKDIQIIVERPNHDPNSPNNPTPVDGAMDQPTDQITFSWSCSDPDPGDSLTYDLYLDSKSNPTTKVRSGISSSTIELNDLGLNPNQKYYWIVVATDNDGAFTPGPIWSFTTEEPPNNPPNSPSNPTPNDGASNQPINNLEVSWSGGDPDGDIVTYTVYADTNPNPSTPMGSVTATSFIVTGLNYSTTYYWKVVADDGKAFPVSGPVWCFTTRVQPNNPPNLPTALNQYRSDGVTIISLGSTTSESTVVMKGSVSDPDSNDVQLEVEVRPVGTSFSNTPTCDSDPVTSGSTVSVTCSDLADGQYHWQARTKDSNGAYSSWVSFGGNPETSPDLIVDIVETMPPTVIGNTPTGGNVPVNTPITITFSEAMNQESVQSAFSTSPATIGGFSWSDNTMTYTPSSNLATDTTYTIIVEVGAKDLAGNNLQSPYSWQFTTASATDTTPPTVIGNTPTDSSVPVNTHITITFSEAMNQESAQSAFSTSPVTIGGFSWSDNTMTYTPSSNLATDTTYTIIVEVGAKDLAGNNLQSPYSWQFTTASTTDTTPPTVIGHTPTGGSVPVNTPISITFSEAMNQESAQSAFSTSSGLCIWYFNISWSDNTMTCTPSPNFVPDTTYTVTVGTGAKDLAGNNLQSPYSWQFTTASSEPTMDIQAEIRNIWTADTVSPVILFGINANLGQVVQADLDADSFSDSLPNYDDRCLGNKNYDKSVISRFREGDDKVRIVLDITGGTGFKPGSEGHIKIVNPEYKITKIFNLSDYIGVQPPIMVDGFPFICTDHSGFGVIIDMEEGSVSWQGRGSCPACACRENYFRMEFLVEKVTVKELTQLTIDSAREHYPAWSPDGDEIVFIRSSCPEQKIIKLELDDLSETVLATHGCKYGGTTPCLIGDPSYSPDGTKVAYGKDDCNGWVDISVVNSDGSSDQCITCGYSGENIASIWYPNSNKIIYANAPNCCNMYPWDIYFTPPQIELFQSSETAV